jgi:7,8-dihydropterin-6-yl-methyl-4-(beta-D-ribofuranosyl)aminobenzene 5'-phosphate synthase
VVWWPLKAVLTLELEIQLSTFRRLPLWKKSMPFLGGFHLTGDHEKGIDPIVEKMKTLNPDYIVPLDCTGWKAIHRFAQEMSEKFILNSEGSTYLF